MTWTLEPTEDERMLRDSVRGVLSSPRDDSWWQMAELGWFALGVPEAAGGLGGSARALLSVMEEAGRALAPEPLLGNVMVAPSLIQADPALCDALAAGTARFAFVGSDPRGAPLRLSGPDRLSGVSGLVLDAGGATHWLVAVGADPPNGAALFCLPRQEAVAAQPVRLLDGRAAARLHFDELRLEPGHRLASGDAAFARIVEAQDRAAAGAVADGFGAAEAGFRLTLDYLKQRTQFGKPLSALQAVQHMAVDAFVSLEQLRSLLVLLHAALDGPAPARSRAVSGAKAFLARRGTAALETCIQLSGGIGVTQDYGLSRFYKRVLTWNRLFGDADSHLDRLGHLATTEQLP